MPHSFTIPPGGAIGFSQMMPASRWALLGYGRGGGSTRGTSRKRRKAKRATRKAKRASGKRKTRMKFGSPAWQKKYKVGRFNKKRRK